MTDVCRILGIKNPSQVAERLNETERSMFNIGRQGNTNIINEPGLYKVILRSDKPEAQKFMTWITHEVLPSIRKYGAYITTDKMEKLMSNPDTWITLITALKNERQEKEKLQVHNVELQTQIETDKPKVIFADAVSASDCDILVGSLAKILKANGIDMGQNRLFKRLRKDGFLVQRKNSAYNLPTQRAMNLGLFTIKETAITHSDGHISVNKTVKVTGKGQQYLLNYFLQKKDGKNEDEQDELYKGENQ